MTLLSVKLSPSAVRVAFLAAVPVVLLAYVYGVADALQESVQQARTAVEAGEQRLRKVAALRAANTRFQDALTRLRTLNPQTRSLSTRIEAIAKAEGFAEKLAGMFKRQEKPSDGIFGIERVEVTFQRLTMSEVVRVLKAIESPASGIRVERADCRVIGEETMLVRLELAALTFG